VEMKMVVLKLARRSWVSRGMTQRRGSSRGTRRPLHSVTTHSTTRWNECCTKTVIVYAIVV
jgi:hypothetical protein